SSSGHRNWNGPYIRGGMQAMTDPWGTPFVLRREGNEFRVTSAGPDQQMGTADDITGW
ncbi:MAG: type II secretion system protein GspG, partial [Kiritimatiellia bacterium]